MDSSQHTQKTGLRSKDNPVVFLQLHTNKQKIGKITFELFKDICPKAAQNYRQFCTGEYLWNGKPAGYKDTCLHRIVEDKYFEGGDFVTNGLNSRPRISIYGYDTLFQDQSFELKHSQPGFLSLINSGLKNNNGNLFRVTAGACHQLDDIGVIFGKAIDQNSLKIIKIISGLPVGNEFKPKYPVVIKECGEM